MPKSHHSINVSDAGSIANNREMHGQLERIRIPIFSGNKMDFQRWNAAFTSCVDMTSLSPQFKMLRLEACLAGEAANTIKGLGYSLEAYEAAKTRLFRKYGGSRRQVQSHIEELKRLQPVQENNAKELETFADVLERAVITLKENGRKSDLEGGALHTVILEKSPERLLAQYYRWLDENKRPDSLETLKDWVSEEAAYQIQATEIKNGISNQDSNEQSWNSKHRHPRRFPRSYFSDKNGRGNQKCCVCTGNHSLLKCEAFQKLSVDERWQTVKRFGLCFRCLASPAEEASNVVLTDVQEPIKVSFIMTERHLLNFVCNQKQNRTFSIRPRPFSQRPTQMRDREKPWRGMVPGNPLPWKRLEIKKDNQK